MQAALLTLEGADAVAFAQAQLTSDVAALAPGQWQWSAWLDARGRCQAFLQLGRDHAEGLVALVRGGDATALADGLRRYLFRANVRIGVKDTLELVDGPALQDGLLAVDEDGLPSFGGGMRSWRLMFTENVAAQSPATRHYIEHDIDDGLPWLPQTAIGQCLPQSLSFERLGAVSFNKGCFPGQEIVARMHYRGGGKQHLHTVRIHPHVTPGATLRHGGAIVGTLLATLDDVQGSKAVAVLNDGVVSAEPTVVVEVEGSSHHLYSLRQWAH